MVKFYPMLLNPALHTKVWGGRKLETVMNKALPTDEPYGESWELHDSVTIANGDFAGKTLDDLLTEHGKALIGENNNPQDGFPLLAKLLHAAKWLSVQVHPNDAQAQELENDPRGKTEAWIILAAEPNAKLVIGVQQGTPRDAMAQAIRENQLEDLLVYQEVQAGDVLYIEANTIHAIGPGVILYEIQQSSNVTYRLYDWGHIGLDGKPRELHIEKGVQVSNIDTLPTITHPESSSAKTVLVSEKYFTTWLYQVSENENITIETNSYFHSLTCIEGELAISANNHTITLQLGQTALIPASIDDYVLSGNGKLLCSSQD